MNEGIHLDLDTWIVPGIRLGRREKRSLAGLVLRATEPPSARETLNPNFSQNLPSLLRRIEVGSLQGHGPRLE